MSKLPSAAENDGFDRHQLLLMQKRFQTINRARFERMRSALGDRQQRVLDSLPLLFHINHPMLPGYVSQETPAGLSQYQPSKDDVKVGKSLARSFSLKYNKQCEDIHGIYVMGSVSTIAQSQRSDLDIWVCHDPALQQNQRDELELKCQRLSDWAQTLRLEVHFFLMNPEAFRAGQLAKLDQESSGSAQRSLLLDEFYRSAVYLAGRTPLWWLVPTHCEQDYQAHSEKLLRQRYIHENKVLDFGGISSIAAGEFIGAGFWQLYKAIESPYKSCLKLLLLESYVSEFPDIRPLSLEFKQAVYDGYTNIDYLDSYVMVYRKIEAYLLLKQQHERLELARRCFYFKVNKPLGSAPRGKHPSWQRRMLKELTDEWAWDEAILKALDKRAFWKAPQVRKERNILVNELNRSYSVLLDFGNATGAEREIEPGELTVLGRKLRAAYEQRPGKIEWINPGISKYIEEQNIEIRYFPSEDKKNCDSLWQLSFESENEIRPSSAHKAEAIRQSGSLAEALFWCYFNGILSRETKLQLQAGTPCTQTETSKLLNQFSQWLPKPTVSANHNCFRQAAYIENVLIVLNGSHHESHREHVNLGHLSHTSDALSYGAWQTNLVSQIDIFYHNSWGEVHTRHYKGEQGFIDVLSDLLSICPPLNSPRLNKAHIPQINVRCIDPAHEKIIEQRVAHFIDEIMHIYYRGKHPLATRFIFCVGPHFHCLQFDNAKAKISKHDSLDRLYVHLSSHQTKLSPIVVDRFCLPKHPLKAIVPLSKSSAVRIFYQRLDIGIELFIKDEYGALFHITCRGEHIQPLKPLHRFLRSVLLRQTREHRDSTINFGVYPIEFFELQTVNGIIKPIRKSVSPAIDTLSLFDIKATAYFDQKKRILFDYACEDKTFSAVTLGDQLEQRLVDHVIRLRRNGKRYPIYLTDIDLSQCSEVISETGSLTLMHFIKAKYELEFRINRALGIEIKP